MLRISAKFSLAGLVMLAASVFALSAAGPSALNYKSRTLEGKEFDLSKLQGKVVLVVNVASECGYTGQYKGLQALYQKFEKQGLLVLGVPTNEFGAQEPGSNEQIAQFCQKNYAVTFPVLEKQLVKGPGSSGLYKYLTSREANPKSAGDVKWNFTKFLMGKNGEVLERFEADVEPDDAQIIGAIEKALRK